MTGPQHYREAETIVATAQERQLDAAAAAAIAAVAQVHATLALTMATALCGPDQGGSQRSAWTQAANASSDEIGRLRTELAVTR